MIAQKDVTHLYIVADAALATTAAPSTARYLGVRRAGELLCDATALVAGDGVNFLYYNQAGKLIVSPFIRFNDVVSCTKIAPVTAVSQVSNIGYNATDGDIVETNFGKYLVTIGFRDTLKMTGGKRLYKYADYTAPATAHKYDIAIGLADSLYANLNQDAFLRVVPKAICSSTVTAANSWNAHNATVVQYSKYVTVGTNTNYTTGGTALAVGDYIRMGTVGGGTALGGGVYQVVELTSSTVIKLDRPITEASGTYTGTSGTSDMEVIPKATGQTASVKWGLTLTGNDSAQPFSAGMYGNNVIVFSVGASVDFSTTEVRLTTSPVLGKGNYHDIADLDWQLAFNHKEPYRIAEHLVDFISNAVSTDVPTYIYNIVVKEASTQTIGDSTESRFSVMIVALGSTIQTALDTLLAALPGMA